MLQLDLVRLIAGCVILGYACYTDIKTRMVKNTLWIITIFIGVVLLIIQYMVGELHNWYQLLFIPVIVVIVYALYYIGLLFGGADAKAIMSLSVLIPFWPDIYGLPVYPSIMPFVWTVFSNSIIVFILFPPAFLIYNALKREVELPFALFGYRMDTETAKKKFVWPLEKVDGGKKRLVLVPEDFDCTEHIEELEKLGFKRIWVTPKVPFMVPLLAGLIISFTYGDIVFSILNRII